MDGAEPCIICGEPTTDRCTTSGHDHPRCADQEACQQRYEERDRRLHREAKEGKR